MLKRGFFAVALMALLSTAATAQGSVSWAAGSPTTAAGQVTGQGTYTAVFPWAPVGGTLEAFPTGGGVQTGGAPIVGPANNNWGPSTIKGLPTGQYTVYASLTYLNATTGKVQNVTSPTAIVNVP